MSTNARDCETIARDLYAALNDHDLDRMMSHVAEDFVDHESTIPNPLPGRAGARQSFEAFLAAFPDLHMDVDDMICQGDRVACRVHMRGTHLGELMGIPASRKPIDVESYDILRIQDGQVAEHWGLSDDMAMMRQIGVPSAMSAR